jgi:hypothetical protein
VRAVQGGHGRALALGERLDGVGGLEAHDT